MANVEAEIFQHEARDNTIMSQLMQKLGAKHNVMIKRSAWNYRQVWVEGERSSVEKVCDELNKTGSFSPPPVSGAALSKSRRSLPADTPPVIEAA